MAAFPRLRYTAALGPALRRKILYVFQEIAV